MMSVFQISWVRMDGKMDGFLCLQELISQLIIRGFLTV